MPKRKGLDPLLQLAEAKTADRFLKKGLRLAHLRLILAVERTGHLSRAADLLATSQPAASRLLTEMEQITGVKLAERQGRGMTLTLYGERLAVRARLVLRELDEADRELENLKSGLAGTVSIGAVTGAAVEYVLPAIRQTRVTHPLVNVSVEVNTSDVLTAALDDGRIDFFIGRVPAGSDPRGYEARYLDQEPLRLIVRAEHPLTRMKDLTLRDCIAYDWVLQPEGAMLRVAVETYLRDRGIPYPAKVLNTSSILLTLMVICQTNAITIVAGPVGDFFTAGVGADARIASLDIVGDVAIQPYSLIKLANRKLAPVAQNFHDLILSRASVRE
ncbi:LysR family transcriptional regulator [Roseibium litorale]|uniref:LysR family transcriptional regulator n=1 Tax=Roseibium litorale TaxID=2803841 RepID=A0ABR9CJW1_9HYPH|nr:LysR family transcriptional regulator [Roseibium litorale]MBD8891139.1 LysR family transcriptional regulator [Roseibium litorale]